MKKKAKDKATWKPTVKKRTLKDLTAGEGQDVKGGAVDSFTYFPPPPPPPKHQ
jgi:hypothetical protein